MMALRNKQLELKKTGSKMADPDKTVDDVVKRLQPGAEECKWISFHGMLLSEKPTEIQYVLSCNVADLVAAPLCCIVVLIVGFIHCKY